MVMIYVFVCIKMKGDKEVIGVGGLSISDALRSKFNGKTSTVITLKWYTIYNILFL